MAVAGPGTVIKIPIRLLPLLSTLKYEIGGVFLFDKLPERTLKVNTITSSLGKHESVDFTGLIKTFGLHPSWFIYHTHPPSDGETYMGLSGQDLLIFLLFSFSSNKQHSIVTHLLTTQTDIHITYINLSVYDILLRLYNAFIQEGGSDTAVANYRKIVFLEYYSILFNLIEAAFSKKVYYNGQYDSTKGYSRDTHALNGLNKLSFIPHKSESWLAIMNLWNRASDVLHGQSNYREIIGKMVHPGILEIHSWMNKQRGERGALDIGLAVNPDKIEEGFFKTTSFKKDSLQSDGTNIILECLDGGYIYDNTESWSQEAPIDPIAGQIIPMIEGGRRKKKRTRLTRRKKGSNKKYRNKQTRVKRSIKS